MAPEQSGLTEAFSRLARQRLDREIETRAARGRPPEDGGDSGNRARWKAFVREHPEHVPDNPWLRKGFEAARLERLALVFERNLSDAFTRGGLFEERDRNRAAAFAERFAKEFRAQTGLNEYPDRLFLAREYSGREHAAKERVLARWDAVARGRAVPELKRECRELLAQAADNALAPDLGNGSLEDPLRREATLAALGTAMVDAARRAAENGLEDEDIPALVADAVFSLYEKTGQCPYALLLLDRIALNGSPLAALPGAAARREARETSRLALERQRVRSYWQKERENARLEEETLIDKVWPFCAAGRPLEDAAIREAGVPERLAPLFRDMAASRYAALDDARGERAQAARLEAARLKARLEVEDDNALSGKCPPVSRLEAERAALGLPEAEGRALMARYAASRAPKPLFRDSGASGTDKGAKSDARDDSRESRIRGSSDAPRAPAEAERGSRENAAPEEPERFEEPDNAPSGDETGRILRDALLNSALRDLITGAPSPNPVIREALENAGVSWFSVSAHASAALGCGPLRALLRWDLRPDTDSPDAAARPESARTQTGEPGRVAYDPDSPAGILCAMAADVARLARDPDFPGAGMERAVELFDGACALAAKAVARVCSSKSEDEAWETLEREAERITAGLAARRARFAAFLRYEAAMVPYFSQDRAPRVNWVSGLPEDVPAENDPVARELARLGTGVIGAPPKQARGAILDPERHALFCALHARVRVRGKTLREALAELFADPAYDVDRRVLPDTPPGFCGPRELAVDALTDEYRRAALDALSLGNNAEQNAGAADAETSGGPNDADDSGAPNNPDRAKRPARADRAEAPEHPERPDNPDRAKSRENRTLRKREARSAEETWRTAT